MEKLLACCYPNAVPSKGLIVKEDYVNFFLENDMHALEISCDNTVSRNIPLDNKWVANPVKIMEKLDKSQISQKLQYNVSEDSPSFFGLEKLKKKPEAGSNVSNQIKNQFETCSGSQLIKIQSDYSKSEIYSDTGTGVQNTKKRNHFSIDYTQTSINDIVVQENPQIELEEIEGDCLLNRKIRINASGSDLSLRHKKDGFTFFGLGSKKSKAVTTIDIELYFNPCPTEELIFTIYFNLTQRQYFLTSSVDTNSKNILFVRLDNPFVLRPRNIVSLGDTHILLEVDTQSHALKIEIAASQGDQVFSKIFSKNFEGTIKLGRSKSNEIVLNNTTLSRTQTSLSYDSIRGFWVIQDGIGNKSSLNGTWIFLNFEWEFLEECIYFRVGKSFLSLKKISSSW